MRKILLALVFTCAAVPAMAQQRLDLDFPGLAERAEDVVDVTVDAEMLKLAARFFSDKSADGKELQSMIRNLTGIYVRSYTFARDGEYDRKLVDKVRAQLGPSWKPLVVVRSKKKENVDIFADTRGENIVGLVVIAAEPRELTVVNIVGRIDIDRLAALEGQFGIPEITGKEKRP